MTVMSGLGGTVRDLRNNTTPRLMEFEKKNGGSSGLHLVSRKRNKEVLYRVSSVNPYIVFDDFQVSLLLPTKRNIKNP